MKLKEEARKSNKDQFKYTNKQGVTNTYKKLVTKTGMVTYKSHA